MCDFNRFKIYLEFLKLVLDLLFYRFLIIFSFLLLEIGIVYNNNSVLKKILVVFFGFFLLINFLIRVKIVDRFWN